MKYAIVRESRIIKTPSKDVEMFRYTAKELNCKYYGNYEVGKVATVVKGRKIPKGTEVVIKRFMEDGYGRSYISAFYGYLNNPAVLVELPDGVTTWTIAENLELLPEQMTGYVEMIETESYSEASKLVEEKYESESGATYWFDEKGKIIVSYIDMTDSGLSVYTSSGKEYLKDCGDVYACILDDWRSDTYKFVVFTKEPKANNLLEKVDRGTPRSHTDMIWDDCTGLESAIDAFNKYISKVA